MPISKYEGRRSDPLTTVGSTVGSIRGMPAVNNIEKENGGMVVRELRADKLDLKPE